MHQGGIEVKTRVFSRADQMAFAELSGDYNPLHVDDIAARRLLYGAPVVHGIHTLLWGLDVWLEKKQGKVKLSAIRGLFQKPVKVGDEVRVSLINEEGNKVRIELMKGKSTSTKIDLEWEYYDDWSDEVIRSCIPIKRKPLILEEGQIEGKSGSMEICLERDSAAKLFPNLVKFFNNYQLAILLGTTRIVGMECPGMHSIFSELNFVTSETGKPGQLDYDVAKFDRRFKMILLNVSSFRLAGVIRTFFRPKPQAQASYLELAKHVRNDEFRGQRAVVVGGSRGLGEVTAKLLAAGGAEVVITYKSGKTDAQKIIKEIITNGGIADCLEMDVLSDNPASAVREKNAWIPTHLYYFATPFISEGAIGAFSLDLFHNFCKYYVSGFFSVVYQLKDFGLKNIFFPSSIFIDTPPATFWEYSVSKAAGEAIGILIEKYNKDMYLFSPRLPMMRTDQTISIISSKGDSPEFIMIEKLRIFRDNSR
jgi:hypothetical protein